MRILVVEDDLKTAELICETLRGEGFLVDSCRDGGSAVVCMSSSSFDCVILDMMLPGQDGLGVLRQMRSNGYGMPVMLLSGRTEVSERVDGLNSGADDYLSKPFSLAELAARVRALLRRRCEPSLSELRVGDLTLDPVTRRARRGARLIDLTRREYELLEFLMRSSGKVCPRMTIIQNVWDHQFDPGTNIVDVYVRKLREKVEVGVEPKLLHSVKGIGYTMKP